MRGRLMKDAIMGLACNGANTCQLSSELHAVCFSDGHKAGICVHGEAAEATLCVTALSQF